mmetsp:Transcript_37766/g.48148  ORF Transcript_37766/g.48148 Transcript_37766/m.48148 type:complete len:397 (-) Transcript_37766:40-1230(-)
MEKIHGFMRQESWDAPLLVLENAEEARPGYTTQKRHEYNDTEVVLKDKVKLLADLLRQSRNALLYTGAGISTASGINDYATQMERSTVTAKGRQNAPRSPLQAQATYAHHALVSLMQGNLIQYWIQQNHDGLPQKAGCPQHLLNEIHGAWYDPSNPVVPMSGNLREDLFGEILRWEQKTDLCFALGTSLSGMNCDRVVTTVTEKAMNGVDGKLGAVVVGLQRTQHDEICALRIFAHIDDVMEMLISELMVDCIERGLVPIQYHSPDVPVGDINGSSMFGQIEPDVFCIPYCGQTGKKLKSGHARSNRQYSILDLREGACVKLTQGPYEGDSGEVVRRNSEGHYCIVFQHKLKKTSQIKRPMQRVLGWWWIEAAVAGTIPMIPVISLPQNDEKTYTT